MIHACLVADVVLAFVDDTLSTNATVSDAEEGCVSGVGTSGNEEADAEGGDYRPRLHCVRFSEDDRVFGEDYVRSSRERDGETGCVSVDDFVKKEPEDKEEKVNTSEQPATRSVFIIEVRRRRVWRPRGLAFLLRFYESFSRGVHFLQSMTHGVRREMEQREGEVREREGRVGAMESFVRAERSLRRREERLRRREEVLVSRQASFERSAREQVDRHLEEVLSWHRRVEEGLVLSEEDDEAEGDDEDEDDTEEDEW